MNAVSIDCEHQASLDEQGRARGGGEPEERAFTRMEFVMTTRRIAVDGLEEVLRMECGRLLLSVGAVNQLRDAARNTRAQARREMRQPSPPMREILLGVCPVLHCEERDFGAGRS